MITCEQCGKEHDGSYGSGRFCCQSCSRRWVALNQSEEAKRRKVEKSKKNMLLRHKDINGIPRHEKPVSEETRRKISESVKKVMNTPEMKLRQSLAHKGQVVSLEARKIISEKNKEHYKNGRIKGWPVRGTENTTERYWREALQSRGIEFVQEKVIRKREDLNVDESGCYFLDFFIPEYNIDLEIDGTSHSLNERNLHDKLRDDRLIAAGYQVYRVNWINSKVIPDTADNDVEAFMTWYSNFK